MDQTPKNSFLRKIIHSFFRCCAWYYPLLWSLLFRALHFANSMEWVTEGKLFCLLTSTDKQLLLEIFLHFVMAKITIILNHSAMIKELSESQKYLAACTQFRFQQASKLILEQKLPLSIVCPWKLTNSISWD